MIFSPGSASFYILLTLSQGERHGYAIMKDVAELSDNRIGVGPATLYTSLKRLLAAGLIQETKHQADADHARPDERRRYYALTSTGKQAVTADLQHMQKLLSRFQPHTAI